MTVDEQEERLNIHLSQLLRATELAAITSIILLCESSCADFKPPCSATPLHMDCMTATELRKELENGSR